MGLNHTLDALLHAACENGRIPGVVATVADARGVIYAGAAGRRACDRPEPMQVDTVAWYASMSKALTAAAAMQLVERGRLSLDAPAGKVIPYLGRVQVLEGFEAQGRPRLRPPKNPVTLRNLLTHSSGFGYEFWTPEAMRELESRGAGNVLGGTPQTLERPLLCDPDTQWNYGPGIDWAGRMVEEVSGQTLGRFLRDHLFDPLGMRSPTFRLGESQRENLAGMHARTPQGQIVANPMEVGQDAPLEMGGHGLYGTLPDYLRFTRMILGGGVLEGTRVLEAATVAAMSQNQMGALRVRDLPAAPPFSNAVQWWPDLPCTWGLSFMINTRPTPQGRAAGSLSWAGIANSYYWIDAVRGVTGALSTQILPFYDGPVVELFQALEAAVYRELD